MRTHVTLDGASGDVGSQTDIPLARPVNLPDHPPQAIHDPMLLLERPRAAAGWDIAILIAMGVAIELTVRQIADRYILFDEAGDHRVALLVLTLFRALLLLGGVAIIVRARRQTVASIGWRSESWWVTGLFGLVATVGAYAALIGTVGAMYVLYPSGFAALQRNPDKIVSMLPKLHPATLCAMSLFVGFYEEIIFRGFLLTRLKRATGSAALAVLLSSVLFAGLHAGGQELAAIIPIFALGVIWAVLTLWRRSVVPAIIGHGLFDLFQMMGLYLFRPDWQ